MRSFIPALNSIDQKIFVMIRSFKLKWSAVVVRGVASDLWLVSGEWWGETGARVMVSQPWAMEGNMGDAEREPGGLWVSSLTF